VGEQTVLLSSVQTQRFHRGRQWISEEDRINTLNDVCWDIQKVPLVLA